MARIAWCTSPDSVRLRLTDEHDKAMADLIEERAAHACEWDDWAAFSHESNGTVTLPLSYVCM